MSTSLLDPEAAKLGKLYRGSNQDYRAGLVKRLELGRRLIFKQIWVDQTFGPGNWIAWLKANGKKLGFSSRTISNRLMNLARDYCEAFGHNLEEPIVALARHVTPKDVRELVSFSQGHPGRYSGQGGDEWYTPPWIVEAARETMGGIDLDPASCEKAQKIVKAGKSYTMKQNGLEQPWFGRVFINPPYSRKLITPFAERLMEAYRTREIQQAVWLCCSETDVRWWKLISEQALICLPYERVEFWNIDEETGERETKELSVSQTVFYLGPRYVPFIRAFRKYGKIVAEWSEEHMFPDYDADPDWYNNN